MRLELCVGDKKHTVEVPEAGGGIGGGPDDFFHVRGAPARLVEIFPEGPVWTVRTRSQASMDGVAFAALIRRLWLPGEQLMVAPFLSARRIEAERVGSTFAVAQDLLGGLEVQAPTSYASLLVLSGADCGRRFPLLDDEAVIGRAEYANVQVRDGSVSRKHARITSVNGRHWVEDLDSPNGVYVNGRRVSRRALLPDAAVIELGQTLLRYQPPASCEDKVSAEAKAAAKELTPVLQLKPVAPPAMLEVREPERATLRLVKDEAPSERAALGHRERWLIAAAAASGLAGLAAAIFALLG